MPKTTMINRDVPTRQKKRMRITIEVECDNHAAMFNREFFNKRVVEVLKPQDGMFAGYPIALLTTEEV